MEGPSVHRLADDLQGLVGQTVEDVAGNARQPIEDLVGHEIATVEAVKKRLVVRTDTGPAAVIHFLMYGTWRLNERRDTEPRLSLRLTEDEFNVYSCSAKVLEGDDLAALDPSGDVLRSAFDAQRARAALAGERIVSDVLLDQDVFGGVGNILKNEALFRARVHPVRLGSELDERERRALFENAVGLTRAWYEAGRAKPVMAIYRAGDCPSCGASVQQAKIGRFERITYWCPRCQPESARLRHPPTPSSMDARELGT